MSDEKKRIPKLRFPGFTEEWEQRKLGELTTYRNGIGHEEKQSDVGKYELVNLNSISIDGGLKPSGKFIDEEAETLIKDDLVMVLSDVGHGDLLGRVAVIPENNRFVLNQRVALLRNNGIADIEYLFSYINAHQRYFKLQGAGSSQLNISRGSVENFEVLLPSKNEQKKIGEYFSSLDHLITLHQRRLKHWEEMKKGLLQKMFPKKVETCPQIRFPGFNDDWEQRKLGDIIEICSGKDYKHLEEGSIPVYGTGGYMLSVSEALSYKEDAIGIGRKGTIDKPYILKAPFWTVDTLFYCVPKPKNNLNFIFDIFQNINWKTLDESTGVPSLSKAVINKVEVLVPDSCEQEKIGFCFSELDNLITLHQRKLEHLQKLKKGLLQQMFV